jgi:hypothetical protein
MVTHLPILEMSFEISSATCVSDPKEHLGRKPQAFPIRTVVIDGDALGRGSPISDFAKTQPHRDAITIFFYSAITIDAATRMLVAYPLDFWLVLLSQGK